MRPGLAARVAALLLGATFVGCGGDGASQAPGASGPDASGASSAPSGPVDSGEAVPAGQFRNPVYERPLADPFVVEHEGTYYVYGTGPSGTEFETASSTDLVTWTPLSSALRGLPSWAFGNAWAPEVFQIGDQWVMYYTAGTQSIRNPNDDHTQCITLAVGDNPAGPFVDESDEPLVCQPELGGSIDATFFRDTDDTPYLIWKNDGNCCRIRTRFFLQELSEDGQELVGEPVELEGLINEKRWEDNVIEAPTLIERDGTYYMFFSGGFYASAAYAVGYATADELLGPYTDNPKNPILKTKAPAAGPGHQSIVADKDGDLWMAYHAWDAAAIGPESGGQRRLWLDELEWGPEGPVVRGPDAGPQPIP
jgi:beta-xylosidase